MGYLFALKYMKIENKEIHREMNFSEKLLKRGGVNEMRCMVRDMRSRCR